MSEPIKREPSAMYRHAAATLRNLYVALCDEGFSNAEALVIVGAAFAGMARNSE